MKCTKCEFENEVNHKFCTNCGEPLSITKIDETFSQTDTNNETNYSNLNNDAFSSQCNYCHGKGHIFSLSRLFLGIIVSICILGIGIYFGTLYLAPIPLFIVGKWVWSGKSCPVCYGLGENYIDTNGNSNITQCISCNGKGKRISIPKLLICIVLAIVLFSIPFIGVILSIIFIYIGAKGKVCPSCNGTGVFYS